MNAETGTKYLQTWELGHTISGGGVGVILDSRCKEFVAGDIVSKDFNWPWQLYASVPASQTNKVACVTYVESICVVCCLVDAIVMYGCLFWGRREHVPTLFRVEWTAF